MILKPGKIYLICTLLVLLAACHTNESKYPTRVGERLEDEKTGVVNFVGSKSSPNSKEYVRASALLKEGKVAESIEIYRHLCDIENASLKPYAYMALGTAYMQHLEYQKGLTNYQISLRMDPTDPEAYIGSGSAYLSLKNYDSAIYYYRRAMKINPKTANSYWGLAVTYYKMNKMDSAKVYAQQFLDVEPGTKLRSAMENILNR